MRVKLNDCRELFVRFHHPQPSLESPDRHRVTVCTLAGADVSLSVGEAHCSISDQFERSVGRKLALTRALSASELSRAERREIWLSYWKLLGFER